MMNPLEDMVKPATRDNQAILDAMTAKAKAAQRAAANGGGQEPYDPSKRKDSVVSVSGIFFHGKNEADEFGQQVSKQEKSQIQRNIDKQQRKRQKKNGKLIAEETDSVISSDGEDNVPRPFESEGTSENKKIPNISGRTGVKSDRKTTKSRSKSARSKRKPSSRDGPDANKDNLPPEKSAVQIREDKLRDKRLEQLKNPVNLFKAPMQAIKNSESARKRKN